MALKLRDSTTMPLHLDHIADNSVNRRWIILYSLKVRKCAAGPRQFLTESQIIKWFKLHYMHYVGLEDWTMVQGWGADRIGTCCHFSAGQRRGEWEGPLGCCWWGGLCLGLGKGGSLHVHVLFHLRLGYLKTVRMPYPTCHYSRCYISWEL